MKYLSLKVNKECAGAKVWKQEKFSISKTVRKLTSLPEKKPEKVEYVTTARWH